MRLGSMARAAVRATVPGTAGCALLIVGLVSSSGAAADLAFPGASRSHYLAAADARQLSRVAKADARAAARTGLTSALVVLDAGQPLGTSRLRLAGSGRIETTAAVGDAMTSYGRAWTRTAGHPALTLVAGVAAHGPDVSPAAGAAWGRTVGRVAARLPGVDVRAGVDVEVEWGPAAAARAWLRGYLAATTRPVVDIGSCTCPPLSTLPTGWSRRAMADIVSANGRGTALPQIYATAGGNATEWATLAKWARHHHRPPVRLIGVLTQQGACTGPPRRACQGIDVSPALAWEQLRVASRQPLRFATDIGYLPVPPPAPGPSVAGRTFLVLGLLLIAAAVAMLVDGLRRRRRRTRAAR